MQPSNEMLARLRRMVDQARPEVLESEDLFWDSLCHADVDTAKELCEARLAKEILEDLARGE
jgi:hypothetical protein